jgi:hypothetical protein
MAKKTTVEKRATKSGMADAYCIAHASLENSTSAMLQFRANHKALQFAGLSSCELHRFAFRLMRPEAFTRPRLKLCALGAKSLVVL